MNPQNRLINSRIIISDMQIGLLVYCENLLDKVLIYSTMFPNTNQEYSKFIHSENETESPAGGNVCVCGVVCEHKN